MASPSTLNSAYSIDHILKRHTSTGLRNSISFSSSTKDADFQEAENLEGMQSNKRKYFYWVIT